METQHTRARRDTVECKMDPDPNSGEPGYDLTQLFRRLDYVVPSTETPAYDYVFQVCGNLQFQDQRCPVGSGICARVRETSDAESIYGYTNTTSVRRNGV